MPTLYLNDSTGLKPPLLSDISVNNPAEILDYSTDLLCKYFVHCDKSKIFFAQNLTTHFAQILSAIKKVSPDIKKVYISNHEIKWFEDMLENPMSQPDSTYSNYHGNDTFQWPAFDVEVFPFENPIATINANTEPAIFFISHISRLTGEVADIATIFKLIKEKKPNSIIIIDGSQATGAVQPFTPEAYCDAYLTVSSKFIGAEPHLGIAFLTDAFFDNYFKDGYPNFSIEKHQRDLYSLFENLKNPLFTSDYYSYIENLKKLAIKNLSEINSDLIYSPENQAPNFLTINFGSAEKNSKLIEWANDQGIIVSDNLGWSIKEPKIPLVRISLSVRTTEKDLDELLNNIEQYLRQQE